jgi:hypothetical protein
MKPPILTAILLVFIVWLNYEIKKNTRRREQDKDSFWDWEKNSNFSRSSDISSLNPITITTERLPLADHPDQTINSYRDTILKLSGKKAINLSGLTNTDLKYEYGAKNLKQLTEYDNNYTSLVSMLQLWAERLNESDDIDSCIQVLEYAVSCFTDVTKSYRLLAECYRKKNTPGKVDELTRIIPNTKITEQEKLIDELIWIKNS